jgi:hypothetical protein
MHVAALICATDVMTRYPAVRLPLDRPAELSVGLDRDTAKPCHDEMLAKEAASRISAGYDMKFIAQASDRG